MVERQHKIFKKIWSEKEDMFDDPFAYAMVPIRNRNITNISTDRFINNLIESDDDVG